MTLIPGKSRTLTHEEIEKLFDGSMKGDRIIEAIKKLQEREQRKMNKEMKRGVLY